MYEIMEKLTLCRICLAKDVRMCDVVNTNLQETYESLTAMQFETKDHQPSQVCYICYAQLQTCHKLRSKSLHSEELFRQVLDGCELKLESLHDVTPLLTIQLVTCLSIVPVSSDTTDTDVKDEEDDDPSLDCSSIIDDVEVKDEHVEGTEDVFDAGEDRIEDGNDENVSETEDVILPLNIIDNSERRTPVDSCPKTVNTELQSLTNIGTSAPAPTELRFIEQENRTASREEVVNDLSEENVNRTGNLSSHIHSDVTDAQYKCNICGKWFKRKQYLLRHALLHQDIKAYGCDICGKDFKRKDHLSSHMLTHNNIRAYVCDVCGKVYKGKQQLSYHILTHTGKRTHTCDVCGKGFTSNLYLKKHSCAQARIKRNACNICGRGFKRKDHLSCHMLTHTGIRAYVCEICGKEFKRKDSLSSHLLLHSGTRAYVCNICGKDFKRKDYLWSHTRTHHTDIRSYYVCDICGKDYNRKDLLSQHILQHIGIRAYACDICGKAFTSSVYLKKHSRIHTSKIRTEL